MPDRRDPDGIRHEIGQHWGVRSFGVLKMQMMRPIDAVRALCCRVPHGPQDFGGTDFITVRTSLDNSHMVAARENVPDVCRGGMPGTECIFPNCERALKERARPRKVTLVPK